MPELHKLTSPLNVIQSKGYTVAILTDGRMSGASGSVPAVIHISPEANDGGMIGKILNNDKIKIDIDSGTFELQVDIKTLNERKSIKFLISQMELEESFLNHLEKKLNL
jgi:phosphogluconate dehydratase